MDDISRFCCPRCLVLTTFRPAVLDALFGRVRVGRNLITYHVSCKYCRRQFVHVLRVPPADAPIAAEVPAV